MTFDEFAFPKEANRDLLRMYWLQIPLFLVASRWVRLSPWNLGGPFLLLPRDFLDDRQ